MTAEGNEEPVHHIEAPPSQNTTTFRLITADNKNQIPKYIAHIQSPSEGKHNTFGKYVTAELDALPSEMSVYAIKLINDVLFEAKIGLLNKDSKLISNNLSLPGYSVSMLPPVSANSLDVSKHITVATENA